MHMYGSVLFQLHVPDFISKNTSIIGNANCK